MIAFNEDFTITDQSVDLIRSATSEADALGRQPGPFAVAARQLAHIGKTAILEVPGIRNGSAVPMFAGDFVLFGMKLLRVLEDLSKPAEDEEPSDEPRGSSRLEEHFIDRTLGPTSEEVLEILTVTQVALSQERSRVKRHARGILGLYQSLPERGSPEDYTRVRAELRAWLERSTVYSPEDLALAPPAESAEVAS